MDRKRKTATEIVKEFFVYDFTERNCQKAISMLSRRIHWYGTSDTEDVHSLEEACRYMRNEYAREPNPYQLAYSDEENLVLSEEVQLANMKCRITGGGLTMYCRVSACTCIEDGQEKICSLHLSVPTCAQEDGEYFPFSLEKKYEQELYRDFLNEQIEGGIIGVYREPGLPFCLANQQMLRLLGYEKEEELRKSIEGLAEKMIYPADRAAVCEEIENQLASVGSFQVEYRMCRKDGSFLWVVNHGKIVHSDGKKDILLSVVNDITEKKQRETEEFRKTQELQNLYDTIPGGVFRCKFNRDLDIVFANQGFYAFLGYSREEFAARCKDKMINAVYPEDRDAVRSALNEQLKHKKHVENTNRLVGRGGSVKWISMHAVLNTDADGEQYFYCTFVDVSAQKKAEEELRLSEQRYRIAVDGAGINVWEYDIAEHRALFPSNLSRHMGGKKYLEDFPECMLRKMREVPEQAEKMEELFRRIHAGEPRVSGEFWTLRNSRETSSKCEKVTYSVLCDAEGKAVRAYGVSVDITQSKLLEKRYREEISYRDRITDSIIASCCLNLTAGIVENMRVSGQGDLAGECRHVVDFRERTKLFLYQNFMTKEQNDKLSPEALISLYNSGVTSVKEEFQALTDPNTYRWIHTDVNLVKSPESEDILAFFYNQDVTDRIMRESITGQVLSDDYEEVSFVDLRSGIYRRSDGRDRPTPSGTQYPYEEAIGIFCERRVAETDRERVGKLLTLKNLQQLLKDGSRLDIQFSGLNAEGEPRYMRLQIQPLKEHPGIILVTRSNVDEIVKQELEKRTQLELAVREAKSANRSKTEFLSRMSHDMRTPMNAIIGMASLGLDEIRDDQAQDYFRKIDTSAHFLLGLINDVLDMSKVESGTVELHPESYYLDEFIDQIDTMIRPLCEAKGIAFEISVPHTVCQCIEVDRLRFNQIFFNLLTNAVKYTPEHGKVELLVEHLSTEGDRIRKRLIVRDNGIGMSREFQKHMFEPFAREQNGISEFSEGTGLGLTITKRMVELMGGTITAKSEKEKGSEFTVELEVRMLPDEPRREEKARLQSTGEYLSGKRVLLCEDHPLNTQIAVKLLEKKKMLVECAENGKKGVSMFEESPPGYYDVILMDIRMPELDGLAATRAIRALTRADAPRVPILAMTANAYDTDVENSLKAGMNAHLSKPIEPQVLYEALEKHLRRESAE